MQRPKILVINPNSNESVTDGLRVSLRAFMADVDIDCCTLERGPFGIESDEDIQDVIPLLRDKIGGSLSYDAFVIACYSDPGLNECRAMIDKPVFGMQESALKTAVTYGGRFGVLALSEDSIRRHLLYIRSLGYESKLAREVALNISVDEAANSHETADKVMSAGQILIDDFRVSAVILGCAGMAHIKRIAETKLPVPVIEPAQAAVELAIQSLRLFKRS